MDKKSTRIRSFFDGVRRSVRREVERRRGERTALVIDVAVFLFSFFLSRRHIAFGAYPLGTALVAVLPSRVWLSLVGVLVGSFSLGKGGVIHAIIALVVVFLRIIISSSQGGEGSARGAIFGEPYVMRVASAAIGAFVGALYEVLLSSFSLSSVLSGCCGVVLTVVASFLYFGVIASDVSAADLLSGTKNIFASPKTERERYSQYIFQISALAFLFLLTLSLEEYDFFGISLAYIFAGALTLLVARRFGAIRGMAVGFVSCVGIGSTEAVGFALVGLLSGLLFNIGLAYALLGGAVVLGGWCAYAGGLTAFLGTIPEYGVSAMLLSPYLKGAKREESREVIDTDMQKAEELVATAVAKEQKRRLFGAEVEEALMLAASAIKEYGEGWGRVEFDEYRNIVIGVTAGISPTPCDENIDILATKLYKSAPVSPSDVKRLFGDGVDGDALLRRLRLLTAKYEGECAEDGGLLPIIKEYELISRMLSARRATLEGEQREDAELSARLTAALASVGFPTGCARVFGERVRTVIAAARDEGDGRIASDEVVNALSLALGRPLSAPECYKRGDIALIVCTSRATLSVDFAVRGVCAGGSAVSGDVATFFERSGNFYSLLSDGMGTGEAAHRTASFVTSYLSGLVTPEAAVNIPLSALNQIMRHKGEEYTATVDLFSLDLYSGEASFTKSGAAASYIKSGENLTRFRSTTPPIGLLSAVEADDIRTRVSQGDVVVMLTDGVGELPEDMPRLIDFLSRPTEHTAAEYAELLLEIAKGGQACDDITVAVAKII